MPTPPELDGALPKVISERISPPPGSDAARDLDALEKSEAGHELSSSEKQAAIRGLARMNGQKATMDDLKVSSPEDVVVPQGDDRDICWDDGVGSMPR